MFKLCQALIVSAIAFVPMGAITLANSQTNRLLIEQNPAASQLRSKAIAQKLALKASFKAHQTAVMHPNYSPNGQQIIAAQGLAQISFSSDGKLIATVSDDGNARIWHRSGKLLAVFDSHEGRLSSVSFSPNTKQIAIAKINGTVKLLDLL